MNRELMVVIVLAIVMIVTAMQAFQLYGLVNIAKGGSSPAAQLNAPAAVGQNPLPAASPKTAGGGAGMVGGC